MARRRIRSSRASAAEKIYRDSGQMRRGCQKIELHRDIEPATRAFKRVRARVRIRLRRFKRNCAPRSRGRFNLKFRYNDRHLVIRAHTDSAERALYVAFPVRKCGVSVCEASQESAFSARTFARERLKSDLPHSRFCPANRDVPTVKIEDDSTYLKQKKSEIFNPGREYIRYKITRYR